MFVVTFAGRGESGPAGEAAACGRGGGEEEEVKTSDVEKDTTHSHFPTAGLFFSTTVSQKCIKDLLNESRPF